MGISSINVPLGRKIPEVANTDAGWYQMKPD